MTAAKDMTREELLARLVEVTADRDVIATDLKREEMRNEDLRLKLEGLHMFRFRMSELTHRAESGSVSDDQIVETVKVWLAFSYQVGGLCPHARTPGAMLDWIREIKNKAAEFDGGVF